MVRILLFLILSLSCNFFVRAAEEADSADQIVEIMAEEIAGEKNLTGSRPWRAPNYSSQASALGYADGVFNMPSGLEINVKFWLDIYTKYTTDQALLHDSEYIDLIYETLDFTHISGRTDLTESQKHRLKSKAIKEAKKRIVEMLKRFDRLREPSTLNAQEKKIWDYFEKIDDKKKFLAASKKGRLRFQLGQRDRIIQGIYFSGRYLEDFEKLFHEAGLPIELTRLVFVESSFNVLARSKVGASGLWQIMRYTARPYMMVNSSIDKRNHPLEATKLAAKLLRMNYNMLESWPLAITGYNHGPAGVLKLTKLYKSREIGDLVKNIGSRKRLGFASRNFYASFLAVLEAERNAPQYYGPIAWSQPLKSFEIRLEHSLRYKEILPWFDGNDRVAQVYNPHITSSARKFGREIPRGAIISVPVAKQDFVLADLEKVKKTTRAANHLADKLKEDLRTYVVVTGDTISGIARDFGVGMRELLEMNHLPSPDHLRVGQTLKIP